MSQPPPIRIAGFASSCQLSQENVQLQEVSSSGQSQAKEEGKSSAPHIQYVELDVDEEMEVVLGDNKAVNVDLNQMNNNPRGDQEEKKEDLKKPFQAGIDGHFPRNLEMGAGAGVRIKGRKKFFYCDLCHVQLSSEETMISHVNGTPHCKKLQKEEEALRDDIMAGRLPKDQSLPEFVKQIPIPTSVKPKIPIRLHQRIKDSEEPIIGLQFITEILSESDPEMEPHYECGVCGKKGSSNSMLSHLNGQDHKKNVAFRMNPRNSNMSWRALRRFTEDESQNSQVLSKLIKTIQSDASYPWPAGKDPRGLERGGAGQLEDWGATGTGGQGGKKRPRRDQKGERPGFGAEAEAVVKLPYPDSVERPQSKEEAEEMIEMGRRLFDLVLSSDFTNFDQNQKENLTNVMKKVVGPRP